MECGFTISWLTELPGAVHARNTSYRLHDCSKVSNDCDSSCVARIIIDSPTAAGDARSCQELSLAAEEKDRMETVASDDDEELGTHAWIAAGQRPERSYRPYRVPVARPLCQLELIGAISLLS